MNNLTTITYSNATATWTPGETLSFSHNPAKVLVVDSTPTELYYCMFSWWRWIQIQVFSWNPCNRLVELVR